MFGRKKGRIGMQKPKMSVIRESLLVLGEESRKHQRLGSTGGCSVEADAIGVFHSFRFDANLASLRKACLLLAFDSERNVLMKPKSTLESLIDQAIERRDNNGISLVHLPSIGFINVRLAKSDSWDMVKKKRATLLAIGKRT
ncbi:hypothetical protein HMPREF0972_02600 [Actinomyces sp. oral taxon 848 str. F0332]|nr:hypothetical protein HMPREF0972_02600 [Actinomyces sp. oral taxon 848 str. F0332]